MDLLKKKKKSSKSVNKNNNQITKHIRNIYRDTKCTTLKHPALYHSATFVYFSS